MPNKNSSKSGKPQRVKSVAIPSQAVSDKKQACVETRRRICKKCGKEIPKERYKNAIYCSVKCRSAYVAYKWCIKHKKFKKPGVGSGGNQWGKDNPAWTNGIALFRKLALNNLPHKCADCGKVPKTLTQLDVHHIDCDRTHNTLDNLVILCRKCHKLRHKNIKG